MAATTISTTLNDLPDVILSNIIAAISDVRTRNAASLVCHKWLVLERATRTSLTLRGNIRDLYRLPTCFRSVTHLDLSLLSPWGHPIFNPTTSTTATTTSDPLLISHLLRHAFPSVTSLTLYSRHPSTLTYLTSQWPLLNHIKLVRWHQRPQLASGEELNHLFGYANNLASLDLSNFYCWTDDIPASLEAHPEVSLRLTSLNLLNSSFSEGFKSDEIKAISKACPALETLRVACMFDPRYIGYVGDEALIAIASNCERLSVLELADVSVLSNVRGGGEEEEDDGDVEEDARISVPTLIEVFSRLKLLEELCLDVGNNVSISGPALEVLNSKCTKLRSLRLGKFQGICMPVESKLDGVALCQRLESLSIKNVKELTDMGLIAIARGCWRLSKFEVQGCEKITVRGMRTLACLLQKTLVDVKISCCKNLGAASSLKALEPIQDRIQRLHIDCVWDNVEDFENLDGAKNNFDLNSLDGGATDQPAESKSFVGAKDDDGHRPKRCKYTYDLNSSCVEGNGNGGSSYAEASGEANGCGTNTWEMLQYDLNSSYTQANNGNGYGYGVRTWDMLQSLSLWIPVGELLAPLVEAGLDDCPNLEEIRIKVEGDCRAWLKNSRREFGLSTLVRYPKLSKMHLDCGDTIGFAHTAPSGHMDLSSWERFYLLGIGNLPLNELDYWPPQDRDVNQRSLSLPAAGLIQRCLTLRKLFIHGTAHEHFMNFFLTIPNLRDVQLREDYYPAPENDMSTEMRAGSLGRFEAALNRRPISD